MKQVLGKDGHWYIALQWDGTKDNFYGIRAYMERYGFKVGLTINGIDDFSLNLYYPTKKGESTLGKLIWREREWVVFMPDKRPRIFQEKRFERSFK